jgi:acyl-CoA thioester hydrolase
MQVLWRGNANAWECDELGHLNVRFYLAKAEQAVADLAERLGMRRPFSADASATLLVREITVRFLAEARPGAPLLIRGGVLDHDETSASVGLVLDHAASGQPAACFTARLAHVAPATGRRFPWPARLTEALEAARITAPDILTPRSLSTAAPSQAVSLDRADALGLQEIGRGRIGPHEVDAFGRMRPEFLFGKISDSVVHFSEAFPEETAAFAGDGEIEAAGAVLEARIAVRQLPAASNGYVIRSGCARPARKCASWCTGCSTRPPVIPCGAWKRWPARSI